MKESLSFDPPEMPDRNDARTVALTANSIVSLMSTFAKPELNVRESLQHCADRLIEALGAACLRVWTCNEAKGTIELQASAGPRRDVDENHSRVPIGSRKIGMIAQQRSPQISNDVMHDAWIVNREWVRAENICAFAGYPLLAGSRLVGVIALFSQKAIHGAVLQMLEPIAEMLAHGIEWKRWNQTL